MATSFEYLCVNDARDKFIVITRTDDNNSYKMYVGHDGSALREVPVFDLQRLRDGGTTYVFTPEGTFYAPSPLRPPAWGPGSDGSCRWPTTLSTEDVCGWPTPDAFRVRVPLDEEESFTRIPAEYWPHLSAPSDIADAERLIAALQHKLPPILQAKAER